MATRGLAAAQLGISATGQNITNASTEGYSRKRIEQSAEWRRDGAYGQMGFGVEVYAINRVRDQFIDRLVNEESTRYGFYAMKDIGFSRIESIFNEPSGTALNSLLNDFWNSWADLANNPNKAGARETIRSSAQSLVGQFNYISTQLRSYKDTINDEIEARVHKINELTEGIYRCNVVITGSEGSFGNKANDTRDQRDKMLEELAQLIDIDYFEDERGALMVSTSGHMLVTPTRSHELTMKRTQITDMDGYSYAKVEIGFSQTGSPFIPKQGALRALMDLRDEDIPRYEEYINDIAKTLITEVNKLHQNGYTIDGLTFIDFFDSDPSKANASKISLSPAVMQNVNNIAAGVGGQKATLDTASGNQLSVSRILDIQTAGTVMHYGHFGAISNLEIRDAAGNLLNPGVDYDLDVPNPGDITFLNAVGPVTVTYDYTNPQVNVPELDAVNPYYVLDLSQINDHYRYMHINSLEVRDLDGNLLQEGKDYDIDYMTAQITFKYSATNAFGNANNPVNIRFDYHEGGFAGPSDMENALAISQLRDKAVMHSDSFGKSTQTINQFYAGALGRLGVERNEASAGLETRISALRHLKTSQDQIMGVNLNEEMANLIQYEHTYQASARFLTTVNSMLETLLNM